MLSPLRTVFVWFAMVVSIGMTLYGIIVRGKTAQERRRQRAFVFLGSGLLLGNNLWQHIGLSETAELAISICSTILVIIGIVLVVKDRLETTLSGGSSAT